MREQIASAIEPTNPGVAALVRDPVTTIEPVRPNPLAAWLLVDVLWRGKAHPRRWFVGVKDEGGHVVLLSGHPERWKQVLDGVRIGDAEAATRLAVTYADSTREMSRERVESVDDIHFLPARSNEIVDAIRQVKATFADRIGPARATGDGPWVVELWTVGDGSLLRHDLTVDPDGSITDAPTVKAAHLPVPSGH